MSDNKSGRNDAPTSSTLSFKVAPRACNKVLASSSLLPASFKEAKEAHRSETLAEEDKDYILETEGKTLKTSKTQKSSSKLVIPMITKNKWNTGDAADGEGNLDQVAAEEIMKELKAAENENAADGTSYIPLILRNRVPVPEDGREMDERYDISIRPDESTLDEYNDIPVSSFGSALLRGMGWSEGKAIGNTNKAVCEPIEYIPRHKGLGLGADKRNDDNKPQRKRKLGDPAVDVDKYKPIIDKDGRVRHVKKVGEVAEDHYSKGVVPGSCVMMLKNPHKGLYGKVVSVDADTARISVELALSCEMIHISQNNAQLVDAETLKLEKQNSKTQSNNSKSQTNDSLTNGDRESSDNKKGKEKNSNHSDVANGKPPWMQRDIRVRIISKSFKGGRYYNKKVNIIDVTSLDRCMCKTDDDEILNDVRESYLETVVPKSKGSYVRILSGKYKGKYGRLVNRSKTECLATLQLLSSKEITTVSFDDIAEFTGRLHGDEIL